MPPPFVEGLTDRVRQSRFGREVLGPKVALPLAAWLQHTFADQTGSDHEPAPAVTAEALDEPEIDTLVGLETELFVEPQDVVGDAAAAEAELEMSGFVPAVRAVMASVKEHNLVVVAAGIAFWSLLAIPATLFAVVSVAGLVLDPATVRSQVDDTLSGLPEEAREIIGDQLEGVSGGSTGGLIAGLVLGLVLALWTSSGAMAKLMAALNTIYRTTETRNFAKLRGLALGLTLGGIVFITAALFLLAVLPALLTEIDAVGGSVATLFNWLRFPLLAAVMMTALGVLYHVGPDRSSSYRPFTVGAAVATILWVALSALFSIYTATVGSYNETYGSIGGIVILLLWLFITAFVVLIGAEIHQRNDRRHSTD